MTHLTKITLNPPIWTVQFNLYKSLYKVFTRHPEVSNLATMGYNTVSFAILKNNDSDRNWSDFGHF